jgi:hypothetical protein
MIINGGKIYDRNVSYVGISHAKNVFLSKNSRNENICYVYAKVKESHYRLDRP